MDRHAERVLQRRIVYWTWWDGGLGGTGCDFEVGLPAFAWSAGGGGSEFRSEFGRGLPGGGDSRFGDARRIDVHGASGDYSGVYREHDSGEVAACFRFRACVVGWGWGNAAASGLFLSGERVRCLGGFSGLVWMAVGCLAARGSRKGIRQRSQSSDAKATETFCWTDAVDLADGVRTFTLRKREPIEAQGKQDSRTPKPPRSRRLNLETNGLANALGR